MADDFGKKIMVAAAASIKRELQARFSAIRDPATGEFPTVIVEGVHANFER